ncbi:DUF4270 domain-containing protein [Reichenbachiella agarivorans]|uniref:DUF4270 domain-containing protein n=1 Tax=Reichenbachiella agarivorans TaxID=2979464 RepID=A0ABY6CTJ1_9BACT|nr:DUF4270 domain-containing protein [Reichenbachiella agarivorans]UXP33813.1 DUF4270 domain-containing protein [Reichenbachiella agarivorans]
MKKRKPIVFVWLTLVALAGIWLSTMSGCSQVDPEIGSDFFDEVSFELVTWDTLTMEMSTVQLDSVITNAPVRLLVGEAVQEDLGEMSAETYFQLGGDVLTDFPTGSRFDYSRVTMTLYFDDYYYGDTTKLMTLEVQELSEDLELDEDGYLYNSSSFGTKTDFSGQPIIYGTTSFYPKPTQKDSIEIDLLTERGLEIFNFLADGEIAASDFKDYLKGFKIVSKDAHCILGFTISPSLKIYYDDRSDEDSEEQTLEFNTSVDDIYFNHLVASTYNEAFLTLDSEDRLSSELTNNQSYVQSGIGRAVRIDLPHIRNILSGDDELLLDKVELVLMIENEIPEETYMLQNLSVYRVDKNNDFLAVYDLPYTLSVDSEYGYGRSYTIDITDFVEEQIALNTVINEDGILLRFETEQFFGTLDHLILADQHSDKEKSIIKLNVVKIKQ